MAKIVQYLFCLFMFSSISLSNIYSEDSTSRVEQGAVTQKKVFKKYLQNILPANMFFGPYAFIYGVAIGGQAIVAGDSPLKANTKWLVAPLLAVGLLGASVGIGTHVSVALGCLAVDGRNPTG